MFDLDGTLLRAPDPVHVAGFDHALRAVFGTGASVESLPRSGRLDRDLVRDALLSAGMVSGGTEEAFGADGDGAAWTGRVDQVMRRASMRFHAMRRPKTES